MEQKEKDLKTSGRCSLIAIIIMAAVVIYLWQAGKNHRESLPPAQQCLSAWDGSHAQMARDVKAMLKNPASFEHLETRYIDRGNEIDLIMKFTGTNSFGAVTTSTATATINKNCELIKGPVIL